MPHINIQGANDFSRKLLTWFDHHGRHDLPWSGGRDPYRIWVSEIMLQQTQVTTVIDYFERFVKRFPDIQALAAAPIDEVLHLWSGLGYYARARNLHRAAGIIVETFGGVFPEHIEEVMKLPGIGRSTAGAILAFSRNQRHPILDGNVKRVLARLHRVEGWPGSGTVQKSLWQLAESYTPDQRVADYTQAIMDLGSMVCVRRRPLCTICPVSAMCESFARGDTDRFPAARPKTEKPVKETAMLMIRNEHGAVLLERRPPTGIWGGLWGFPECELRAAGQPTWRHDPLGIVVRTEKPWAVVRHTFTHFRLDITPIPATIEEHAPQVMENAAVVWYKPGEAQAIGLAAPVNTLIQKLR